MSVSKAQQKATNKYIAKAYDRVNLTLPKGRKAELQAHAERMGESLNGFIGRAIDTFIRQDTGRGFSVSDSSSFVIPSEMMKEVEKAANATGEDVISFVSRAVKTQAKRDQASIDFGINPATGEKID